MGNVDWNSLEGKYYRVDVGSTTADALGSGDNSVIYYTTDGNVVLNGQVFGDYDFGIDLEYMVFNTKYASNKIMEKLNDEIDKYVYHSDNISIYCDINFGDSCEGYDYAVLDIYINGAKSIGFLIDKNDR